MAVKVLSQQNRGSRDPVLPPPGNATGTPTGTGALFRYVDMLKPHECVIVVLVELDKQAHRVKAGCLVGYFILAAQGVPGHCTFCN